MDTIYEENADHNPDMPPPSSAPRRILRAIHRLPRDDNVDGDPTCPTTIAGYEATPPCKVINVERFVPVRVLGEGAFGAVLLVVDKDDHTIAAAVKRISLHGLDPETSRSVKKEALIQRACRNHRNVLKYITMRAVDENFFELYIEYADGGELFDQIEPDYGMEPIRAQFYFRQLMNGIQYLHANGIAHRDIKPENLLLDRNNTLKISDFGMATVFRIDGKTRMLGTRCGTIPYAAPEVFHSYSYDGPPVDVWSAGVVLVTMLTGEMPFPGASRQYPQYKAFMDNDLQHRPWCRMDTQELSLFKIIFVENPLKRATIPRIKRHPWFVSDLPNVSDWKRPIPKYAPASARPAKMPKLSPKTVPGGSSQPADMHSLKNPDTVLLIRTEKPCHPLPLMSFSQPVNVESMLLNRSQVSSSQHPSYAHPITSLVRRMTRFCVTISVGQALEKIQECCKRYSCEYRLSTEHQLLISCSKTNDLAFVATVYEMVDGGVQKVLIDFRLSKGDGLEFKRKFLDFKKFMSNVICKHSSDWLEEHGLVCRLNATEIVSQSTEKYLIPPAQHKENSAIPARPAEV